MKYTCHFSGNNGKVETRTWTIGIKGTLAKGYVHLPAYIRNIISDYLQCQKVEQIEVDADDYFVLECPYNRIPINPRAEWKRQVTIS